METQTGYSWRVEGGSTERSDIDGGVVVFGIIGEHDLHTAGDLRAQFNDLLGDASSGIVVDLSKATFIDSSTVGVLLEARQITIESSKRFAVHIADSESSSSVRRIFDITGLSDSLPVISEFEQAIHSVKADG